MEQNSWSAYIVADIVFSKWKIWVVLIIMVLPNAKEGGGQVFCVLPPYLPHRSLTLSLAIYYPLNSICEAELLWLSLTGSLSWDFDLVGVMRQSFLPLLEFGGSMCPMCVWLHHPSLGPCLHMCLSSLLSILRILVTGFRAHPDNSWWFQLEILH